MGRTVTRRPRTDTAAVTAEITRPLEYGVETGASAAVLAALLKYDKDTAQPFCTCTNRRDGFGFDPQIGVYVHAGCWKPSKAMYAAALQAGVLEILTERGAFNATEEPRSSGRRESVQVPPSDGDDGTEARSGADDAVARREAVAARPARRPGEEPGADEVGGGDVLGERFDSEGSPRRAGTGSSRRVTRRSRT